MNGPKPLEPDAGSHFVPSIHFFLRCQELAKFFSEGKGGQFRGSFLNSLDYTGQHISDQFFSALGIPPKDG